jgi:hypothetical protein
VTEQEWLAGTDPPAMLTFLRGKASERSLRLFCCACCRQVSGGLSRARKNAVDIAERFADGQAGWWKTFWGEFLALPPDTRNWENRKGYPEKIAAHITIQHWKQKNPDGDGVAAALDVARLTRHADPPMTEGDHVHLLFDIFGNPFRPVALDPRWLTSTVLDLARTIYDERVYERMPILADALMDAGCGSDEVINHCRSDGPHVRGCWVVDLILGKE